MKKLFFIAFLLGSLVGNAQQQYLPLSKQNSLQLEREVNRIDSTGAVFHTAFKPYRMVNVQQYVTVNEGFERKYLNTHKDKTNGWWKRKFFEESLIVIDTGVVHLSVDLLFNFAGGKDLADDSIGTLYNNTRGFIVRGDLTKKLSFVTTFYENQTKFPGYVNDFISTSEVAPGEGRVKPYKSGYDYGWASGYVSYSPVSFVNIQFGHDKNFIGDGYRSLLLSDNAFNYPFLKITTSWLKGRLQYTNTFASLQTLERFNNSSTPEALFKRKAGTFHYLSYAIGKRVEVGIFEGIVWQQTDDSVSVAVDKSMFVPIIGLNTMLNGMNGVNNALLGLNLKVKATNKLQLYEQLMFDGVDKFGVQLGFKGYDAFTLKNLAIQGEFNWVSSRGYSHATAMQSYTHYNQPLAHSMGASFTEIVGLIDYSLKNWMVSYKMNFAVYSTDGKDPLIVDVGSIIGETGRVLYNKIEVGYMLLPKTNMRINLGVQTRYDNLDPNHRTTNYVYFGFRTNLNNNYYDF